ncbi:hypothetical protein ABPG74_010007 [Tetrahymena malaccensis]
MKTNKQQMLTTIYIEIQQGRLAKSLNLNSEKELFRNDQIKTTANLPNQINQSNKSKQKIHKDCQKQRSCFQTEIYYQNQKSYLNQQEKCLQNKNMQMKREKNYGNKQLNGQLIKI